VDLPAPFGPATKIRRGAAIANAYLTGTTLAVRKTASAHGAIGPRSTISFGRIGIGFVNRSRVFRDHRQRSFRPFTVWDNATIRSRSATFPRCFTLAMPSPDKMRSSTRPSFAQCRSAPWAAGRTTPPPTARDSPTASRYEEGRNSFPEIVAFGYIVDRGDIPMRFRASLPFPAACG